MTFRPLYDRVLIKRTEAEAVSKSGLIIPERAQERALSGTVVAVGQGRLLESGEIQPLLVRAGDTVYFGKFTGDEIQIEGEQHLVVRESDLWGVAS